MIGYSSWRPPVGNFHIAPPTTCHQTRGVSHWRWMETNKRCSPAPWSLLADRMKDKGTLPLDPPLSPAAGSLGTLLVWMTGYKRQCSPIDSATITSNPPGM